MWYLAYVIFAISFTLQSVHTLAVHSVNVVDESSMDLNEILHLFDVMVKDTSTNALPSLMPVCPVQPIYLPPQSIMSVQSIHPDDIATSYNSPLFSDPRICVVSKEELDEIWNALQDEEANGVPSTIVASPHCSELEKMKIRILKLKSSFQEILKYQVSSAKYEELKASYEEKLLFLQKQVDDAKTLVSEADAENIASLQEELQKQRDQINGYLKKIEEDQNVINDAFVGLIVADIEKKQIDSAMQVFNVNVTNKSQIRRIVSLTYNGSDSNVNKILPFLRRLIDSDTILVGYTALYNEMKSKNQLTGINMLKMSLEVFKKREDASFKSLVGLLIDTMKQLHGSNGFDSFYEFARKDNDLVKEMMAIYVQIGFDGNYENIQKMLDLMPKFDKLIHKMYLLNNLISELKVPGRSEFGSEYTPEMLVMMYNVIQLRSQGKDDQSTRNAIKDLENNIPEALRDLMFKNLCIQNSEDSSFLYAGDTLDENRRVALTSKSSEKYGNAFSWQIEFIDNGKKVMIKNEKYNEPLYIVNSALPREAQLWRPDNLKDDPQAHFTIELQNSYWSTFGIFSPKLGGSLEVSELSGDTRRVRSLSDSHSDEFEHGLSSGQIWFIKTCRLPV